MRLRYAAFSDVGRVRKDNQDSGYAGPHLLVVADGVGGSARGDVASAETVEVLRRLDTPPGNDVLGALAGAIHLSHDRIAELVAADPSLEGTSTTVTALVLDGDRIAVGHVGDSRGYLLRDGTLAQLTTDHTFVQSLVDEGRITEDEARVHPHRNLILRAVDGVHEPEPDVFTLEVAPGDRILLCSDGASGVLTDEQLTRILAEGTPDSAAYSLVDRSLDAGSSDNVTVVVADLVDDDAVDDPETSAAATTGPMLVGAAAEGARSRGPGGRIAGARDTGELEPVGDTAPMAVEARRGSARPAAADDDLDPEEARYAPRPPKRFTWARRTLLALVLLLAVGLIAVAAYRWTQDQYYVGDDAETVAIFRGIEADVPGLTTHRVEEPSELRLTDLPDAYAREVSEGISASSLADARDIVQRLERRVTCPEPAQPSASPSTGPSASASPTPSASSSPPSSPTTSALCTEADE
ncbi:PP2C family protein-serine/threonine phosphatase [Nocardioides aurantiacus]|uniref:Protein phosphatase n=1 Tax=Nocardioides aurantiacus TaxID=86796 RepID=A0A3N2CZX7_9ACTN|nr:protein phosphatase 2C domain-containing protein [Nocardioides aurantiacus]ROR92958.1 protein phosphatase [Nocardioides aurantiacus]